MATIKPIITTALLAFVAATLATFAVKEWRRSAHSASRPAAEAGGEKLVVYCFHRTVRCTTCLRAEAYTNEALEAGFAEQLADGRIEFQAVDVEQPENRHFVKEYDAIGAAVVLVQLHDGQTLRWENLVDAIRLLDEKELFVSRVQDRVRAFLDPTTRQAEGH